MDDSDDYVFDDIVFDAHALAVLDQEEKKYLQTARPTPVLEEPINKRQKTNTGWNSGIGATVSSGDMYDDLPEISLRGDGSYGIGAHRIRANNQSDGKVVPHGPKQTDSLRGKNVPSDNVNVYPPNVSSRNSPNPQASSSRHSNTRQANSVNTRHSVHNGYSRVQEQRTPAQDVGNSLQLQTQMLELQRKLEELREENSRIQVSLKEAVDTKLAKEGEVSILRKNIEKTSQNHAAQLLQLRTEKEQAEMRQAQIQKDMKDEMERLRSQMLFKQQELDSSMMRKLPGSVRAKKVGREYPSTPLAVPPAISSWSRGPSQSQMLKGIGDETPLRASRVSQNLKQSPSKPPRKSPEKSRKTILPGFHDAFESSLPVRSPSKQLEKAKSNADSDSAVFGGGMSQLQLSYVPSQKVAGPSQPRSSAPNQPRLSNDAFPLFNTPSGPELSQVASEEMDVLPTESDEDAQPETMETFDPINWKAELCRIILTHCHPLTGQITFQQLIGLSESTKSSQEYVAACSRMLEVISNPTRIEDCRESIQVVCNSLLTLLELLHNSHQFPFIPLLLNLFTRLVLSVPMSRASLLASRYISSDNDVASILDIVSKLILENLDPTKCPPHRDELALEILSFLEVLFFNLPQESISMIEGFARNQNVILLLLHASQPVWLLEKAVALLTLLSTHHNLFRSILAIPLVMGEDREEEGPIKNSFVERLCSQLIDLNKTPTEKFKTYILTLLSQLSIAHADGYATLVGSNALIPSLVLYVSHLTTPLWEEDEKFVSSPEVTFSHVRTINQATLLLYYLIFGTDPCLNLRYKLQHAPHRPFNSINHVFVVTFGRLSYCDPPSWVNAEVRQELESLAEISRDILEVVVDGPEGDSVWAAFQNEPDEDSAMDEEELEARLIGTNR